MKLMDLRMILNLLFFNDTLYAVIVPFAILFLDIIFPKSPACRSFEFKEP